MPSDEESRVVVHSKLTVVSTQPVSPGKTHSFSALDHAMGLHSLHVVFYYRDRLFGSFDLDPLRASLAETLSLHPQVTGRIARKPDGNWGVNCNDAGVRALRARVGTTLDEWLRSADGSEERLLTVWDDMPDEPRNWSPYRIQINEFEGGGVAIGLSCTHMHADPSCVIQLVKFWADTHRREPLTHALLTGESMELLGRPLDQDIYTKPSATYYEAKAMAAKTITSSSATKKMGTATFIFSNAIIKQRLLQVRTSFPDATPFDFLAALFWTHIAKLKPGKSGTKHCVSICTDFGKKRFGFYGNALHFSLLSVPDVEEVEREKGVAHVAGAVHRHVMCQEEEFWAGVNWFEAQKGDGEKFGAPFRMYGPDLTFVSMEHMIDYEGSMYAAKFEQEKKPVHVSYHVGNVEGEGLIMVTPAAEGGFARVVTVTLPVEELAELREAPAILSMEPTMLLSGRQT